MIYSSPDSRERANRASNQTKTAMRDTFQNRGYLKTYLKKHSR